MSENNLREAQSITGMPHCDGEVLYFEVGHKRAKICPTRITVTCDLPGMYGDLERVRVYDGDLMVWEGPLHNLEGVHYLTDAMLAARGEVQS